MKNKVIPRITRRIISICVILSIIVTGIEPWQIVKASDAVHVYTLDELRTAIANNSDIILEEDIKLSDYTFEYSEEHRRIGIYSKGNLKSTYDVDDNKYYEDYISENAVEYNFSLNYEIDNYFAYYGSFDGNGHALSGIIYGDRGSMFHIFSGELKNLTWSNCYANGIEKPSSQALLSYMFYGRMTNCSIENSYIVSGTGGAAGFTNCMKGEMKDCTSDMHIFANDALSNVAGLVRITEHIMNNDSIIKMTGCEYSGIIEGKAYKAAGIMAVELERETTKGGVLTELTDCVFSGRIGGDFEFSAGITTVVHGASTVNSESAYCIRKCINRGKVEGCGCAAGIMFTDKISRKVEIEGCSNEGVCIAKRKCHMYGNDTYDKEQAGGILVSYITEQLSDNDNIYITKCSNYGSVISEYEAGGIASIVNEIPEFTLNISSCINKGDIMSSEEESYAGGIVAFLSDRYFLYNNYNSGNISGPEGKTGGIAGGLKYRYMTTYDMYDGKTENCVNTGKVNDAGNNKPLFGMYENAYVRDCYEVMTADEEVEIIGYQSEDVEKYEEKPLGRELVETVTYDNYKELCDSLNRWVCDMYEVYEKEYLSTWVYSENELKYGEVDSEYLNSLRVPTPTAIPTMTPSPTPEPPISHQITQPPVLQGNNQNQSENQALTIKLTIKSYIRAGKKVILKWKKNTAFSDYSIYRSAKKKGKYMPLKNSVKAGTYTDTKVKANETWYYKIRGCIIINGKKQYGAWSEPVKAAVGMRKPEITLKKEVTPSGEKYVRMRVKKCDGQYIQVYVRTKQKRYNLVRMPNSDWRKMKSTFNFRYSVGGKKMYFRIRSYGTYNNKLIYSPYSDSEGIKL